MRLKLLTNIGDIDNRRFELEETREGEIAEVEKKEVADELLSKGWATTDFKEHPVLRAVPPANSLEGIPPNGESKKGNSRQ